VVNGLANAIGHGMITSIANRRKAETVEEKKKLLDLLKPERERAF